MEKKFQIFISSTYVDLKEERQKVCDTVLTLYQIPIGMEMFSAADEEQWEIIKSHIDSTDFYVLIVGNRYGSVIKDGPDAGISYTEKEYNYAVSKGVPVLAFLIDENVPVKPSFVEKEHIEELKAFKRKVLTGREAVWWTSPDDLATKVSQSLAKQILRNRRPGWVRATSALVDNADLLNQINELRIENKRLNSLIKEYQKKEKVLAELPWKETVDFEVHPKYDVYEDIPVKFTLSWEEIFIIYMECLMRDSVKDDIYWALNKKLFPIWEFQLPDHYFQHITYTFLKHKIIDVSENNIYLTEYGKNILTNIDIDMSQKIKDIHKQVLSVPKSIVF